MSCHGFVIGKDLLFLPHELRFKNCAVGKTERPCTNGRVADACQAHRALLPHACEYWSNILVALFSIEVRGE